MKAFLIAIQFLTRLPVNTSSQNRAQDEGISLLFYPLVGGLIGLVLFGIFYYLQPLSSFIAAAIVITVWVLLSGALHLDGLADSADAWLGGQGNSKRSLEIMKDPNCGPAGVVAIVLILLIKFSVLIELYPDNAYILILAPLLGRSMVVLLFLTTPYVREQGLGRNISRFLPRKRAYMVLTIVFFIAVFSNLYGTYILVALFIIFYLLRRIMIQRLNGITGDTAGATLEIIECFALVFYALIV